MLQADFLTSRWGNGATSKIRISNSEEATVNDWKISFLLDYKISRRRNGAYEIVGGEIISEETRDDSKYKYTIKPSIFNKSLRKNETAFIVYNADWNQERIEPSGVAIDTLDVEGEEQEILNHVVTPFTNREGAAIFFSLENLAADQEIFVFNSSAAIAEGVGNGEIVSRQFDGTNYEYGIKIDRINAKNLTFLVIRSRSSDIEINNLRILNQVESPEPQQTQLEINSRIQRWSHNSGATIHLEVTNEGEAISSPEIKFESNFQLRGRSTDIWNAEIISEILEDGKYIYTLRLADTNFKTGETQYLGFNTLEAAPKITFTDSGDSPVELPEQPPSLPPVEIPDPVTPPSTGESVERPEYNLSTGFFTLDGKIYDANGVEFIARGVNNRHVWFDSWGETPALNSLDNIASFGFNSVRIVWEIDIADGRGGNLVTDDQILEATIEEAIANKLVPMVELHDFTGSDNTNELLNRGVGWWADRVEIWNRYEESLMINIANEFGGYQLAQGSTRGLFPQVYKEAITLLRNAGVNNTLVIDPFHYGKDFTLIEEYGREILEHDPQQNVIFSVHFYNGEGENPDQIRQAFDSITGQGLPLIIGEFGPTHSGRDIRDDVIIAEAEKHGVGTLAWAWEDAEWSLTQNNIWEANTLNDLTSFGRDIVAHADRTSELATIF